MRRSIPLPRLPLPVLTLLTSSAIAIFVDVICRFLPSADTNCKFEPNGIGMGVQVNSPTWDSLKMLWLSTCLFTAYFIWEKNQLPSFNSRPAARAGGSQRKAEHPTPEVLKLPGSPEECLPKQQDFRASFFESQTNMLGNKIWSKNSVYHMH